MCVEHIKINNRINVEPPRSEVENQSMRHIFRKMGFKIDHHKSAGRSTILNAKKELERISSAIELENKMEDPDFGRSPEKSLIAQDAGEYVDELKKADEMEAVNDDSKARPNDALAEKMV
eukprot:UN25274